MRLLFVPILLLVTATAAGSNLEAQPVENVGTIMVAFGAHLDDHPAAGAEDLYKLLHQAVYGPGHAIPNRQAAADWMERELDGLGPPLGGEPACEALGGEPPLVRVNLRPFVASGADPDLLLDAFVASANQERGTSRRMEVVLLLAVSSVQRGGRGELSRELKSLAVEMADQGYPAIHHSQAFLEAYRPAYRVVEDALAAEHGWCDQ